MKMKRSIEAELTMKVNTNGNMSLTMNLTIDVKENAKMKLNAMGQMESMCCQFASYHSDQMAAAGQTVMDPEKFQHRMLPADSDTCAYTYISGLKGRRVWSIEW
jgi:hypothetical protein